KKVPKGKVATYAQIAALSGRPHAVRAVVWILHSSSRAHRLPWHRILKSKGAIAFPLGTADHARQKALLKKEGVEVDDRGRVDLLHYQWRKKTPCGGTRGFRGVG